MKTGWDECFYCSIPWSRHSLDDKKACADAYEKAWRRLKNSGAFKSLPVLTKDKAQA